MKFDTSYDRNVKERVVTGFCLRCRSSAKDPWGEGTVLVRYLQNAR